MTDTTDSPALPEHVYLMPEMLGGLAEPGGSRTAEYVRADLARPASALDGLRYKIVQRQARALEVAGWHEAADYLRSGYMTAMVDEEIAALEPAPEVVGLVEALQEVDELIVSHGFSPQNVMREKIRVALAAYEEKKDG